MNAILLLALSKMNACELRYRKRSIKSGPPTWREDGEGIVDAEFVTEGSGDAEETGCLMELTHR